MADKYRQETRTNLKIPKASKAKKKEGGMILPGMETTQWPLGDKKPSRSKDWSGKRYPADAPTYVGDAPNGDRRPKGHKTQELNAAELTAPQADRMASNIAQRVRSGALPEGNVELAALLGYGPAIKALGRNANMEMSAQELINFLLTDPNVKIRIDVGE